MDRRTLLAGLTGLGLLAAAPAEARGWEAIRRSGRLRVAVEPDAPPFAFAPPAGGLVGYDIDVATAIAARLDVQVSFLTPGWNRILAGGWGNLADIAVAGITPTSVRRRTLDLPVRYGTAAVVAIAPRDGAAGQAVDLAGQTVAVSADTTAETYLANRLVLDDAVRVPRRFEPAEVLRLVNDRDVIDHVTRGKVDGGVVTLAEALTAERAGLSLKILPGLLYVEPISVAVPRGQREVAARVRDAVDGLRADGVLSRLSQTWFGIDLAQ